MIARPTLQAIQIAKRQLEMEDDDYRAMLLREGGVDSSTKLDEAGARRVMAWFDNAGFVRTDKRRGTSADKRPIALKARALWISLYQLDEVVNRHDLALDAFAKTITGKDTLRFALNGEVAKVVEALKAWAERVGWSGGTRPRLSLVQLQYRRLLAAECAVGNWVRDPAELPSRSDKELSEIADAMGAAIRRLQLGDRHKSPSQQGT